MKCWNRKCRAVIRESDRRDIDVPSSRDEPGHVDVNGGCRFCQPSDDEVARDENAADEALFQEERGQ